MGLELTGRKRMLTLAGLLLVGLLGWLEIFGRPGVYLVSLGSLGPGALGVVLLIAMGLAVIPVTAGWIDWGLGRIRFISVRVRTLVGIFTACFSGFFLWWIARGEHRQFFPYVHDEFSYLIQAHQLAGGYLWRRGHPLGAFFESFQVIVSPVYASAYFPGTALLYVPGVWFGMQPFVTSLLVSGCVAGLLFWIVTEIFDAFAGVLAVLLLLSDGMYRQLSIMTMGQMPLLFYALLGVVAWLRWRVTGAKRWGIAVGFFLGLAAITRPVDALCFGVPIGVGMVMHQRRGWALAVVGAFPWLMLQLILNHGVTGHWLQTPFGMYADRNYPGSAFGFHRFDSAVRPVSDLPQMQALFARYRPMIEQHRLGNVLHDLLGNRLRYVGSQVSQAPFPVLILFAPLCLLSKQRRSWLLVGTVPLFLFLYAFYVFFFPHYALACGPGVIVAIVAGARGLEESAGRWKQFARVALTLFIAAEAIAALPIWSMQNEDMFDAGFLANVNSQLSGLKGHRAVVLFRFDADRDVNLEPVYNQDTGWPDDAQIIRAHDRGAMDGQLFEYYRKFDPGRRFFLFDEKTGVLKAVRGGGES